MPLVNLLATAIVQRAVNQIHPECAKWDQSVAEWTPPRIIDEATGRRASCASRLGSLCPVGVDKTMKFEGRLEGRELASRPPRVEAGFVVRLRCAEGEFPARITNLSSSGFRLRSARPLEPGWEISLEVPRRPSLKCLVRWCDGKEAGGVFVEPAAL